MHALTCSSSSQVHLHAQPHLGHPHPGQGRFAHSALCLAALHGTPYAPTPPVDQISVQWVGKKGSESKKQVMMLPFAYNHGDSHTI